MKELLAKILKPKEHKKLHTPLIDALDLTKGRSNGHVDTAGKEPSRTAIIVYQKK